MSWWTQHYSWTSRINTSFVLFRRKQMVKIYWIKFSFIYYLYRINLEVRLSSHYYQCRGLFRPLPHVCRFGTSQSIYKQSLGIQKNLFIVQSAIYSQLNNNNSEAGGYSIKWNKMSKNKYIKYKNRNSQNNKISPTRWMVIFQHTSPNLSTYRTRTS